MELFDVTIPIREGMVVYEGDPPVRIDRVQSLKAGDVCNLSRLELGAHTGTHLDAPVHFIEGGAGVDEVSLYSLIGPVQVVDATFAESHIDESLLAKLLIPAETERIIFKTRNSALWDREEFDPNFIGLTEGAARHIVARGIHLVGIDYLSVAPKHDPAPAHTALLGGGVVIIEGLDLRGVEPGEYNLVCLPMLIEGGDGAPARVLLMRG